MKKGFRKILVLAVPMLVLIGGEGISQSAQLSTNRLLDSTAAAYELDLSLPRSPAFLLADMDAENILRPSTAHELVVSFSNLSDSAGGFRVPSTFGVEFSPALIIAGPYLTLKGYQDAPFLYRLQISASARQAGDDMPGSQLAIGLRVPIIDESDQRDNESLLRQKQGILDQINALYVAQLSAGEGKTNQEISLDLRHAEMADALMDQLREFSADTVWNAQKLQLAGAIKFHARDAQGHDPFGSELAAWLSYSQGWGKYFQWLVGLNITGERELSTTPYRARGTLGARVEMGSNWIIMFAEGGISDFEGAKRARSTFNTGLDVRLGLEGLWMNISAGALVDHGNREISLRTNADLKYNTVGLWRMLSVK